jgi:hypothetical protein
MAGIEANQLLPCPDLEENESSKSSSQQQETGPPPMMSSWSLYAYVIATVCSQDVFGWNYGEFLQ